MPAKNSVKQFVENGHYHAYNRGVDKRTIFQEEQDYRVFLNLLKRYLSDPKSEFIHPISEITGVEPIRLRLFKNFFGKVDLLAYCLMPNHFHLLLRQAAKKDMSQFLQALCTSYTMYFNKKYNRQGTLFQGPYRAVLILNDPYLLHVSRYIHLNPNELTGQDPVSEYPYSSYAYYLGKKNAAWLKKEPILAYFKTQQRQGLKDFFSYQSFVEDYQEDPKELIGILSID